MLINFPYIERNSPVHRLDARAKLLLLLSFSLTIAQTSNVWVVLAGFVFAAIYYSQAHLHWHETRRVWTFLIVLNVLLLLGNFFLTGKHVIRGVDVEQEHVITSIPFIGFQAQIPFIHITQFPISVEILTFLLTQALRNFGIVFLAIALPYTTNPGHYAIAFKGLGLSDSPAYAIELSLRFLPSVGRDFSTTLDAQRARGFKLDKLRGGIFGKIARIAPLLVPLVIGSIIGAEDIINAMELRCFGQGKRTWLVELHARLVDRVIMIGCLLFFMVITLLNIAGYFYTTGPLHILHVQGIPGFLLHL